MSTIKFTTSVEDSADAPTFDVGIEVDGGDCAAYSNFPSVEAGVLHEVVGGPIARMALTLVGRRNDFGGRWSPPKAGATRSVSLSPEAFKAVSKFAAKRGLFDLSPGEVVGRILEEFEVEERS